MPSEQAGKQLIITPSVGYLVTTSVNTKPQPQQTLPYIRQADGSCLAQATVTVLADGPALISGTVTLHDPLGERIVLAISIETELFLESPTLTLVQSESDEQATALLHISQQGAHTPVVLSTDKPNQFSFAIGNNPQIFTPTLTFTPVFAGTYVHVRYVPTGFGWHTARLTAKTPYSTQTVSLQGQVDWPLIWETQLRSLTVTRVQKVATLAILIVSALAYVGYAYWSRLNPGLDQSRNRVNTTVTLPDTALVRARVPIAETCNELSTDNSIATLSIQQEHDGISQAEQRKNPYVPRLVKKASNKKPSELTNLVQTWSQTQPDRRVIELQNQAELAKNANVSELEQELNQKRRKKY